MDTRLITLVLGLAISAALPYPAAPASAVDVKEREVAERVNALRREHQRPLLRADDTLARVAREYSCELARRGTLSHTDAAGKSVADRVRAAGKNYRVVGENLASNTNARDPVAAAIKEWMRSKGHRDNILRPDFTETGVGVCRSGPTYYFTQVFLRPPAPR